MVLTILKTEMILNASNDSPEGMPQKRAHVIAFFAARRCTGSFIRMQACDSPGNCKPTTGVVAQLAGPVTMYYYIYLFSGVLCERCAIQQSGHLAKTFARPNQPPFRRGKRKCILLLSVIGADHSLIRKFLPNDPYRSPHRASSLKKINRKKKLSSNVAWLRKKERSGQVFVCLMTAWSR